MAAARAAGERFCVFRHPLLRGALVVELNEIHFVRLHPAAVRAARERLFPLGVGRAEGVVHARGVHPVLAVLQPAVIIGKDEKVLLAV